MIALQTCNLNTGQARAGRKYYHFSRQLIYGCINICYLVLVEFSIHYILTFIFSMGGLRHWCMVCAKIILTKSFYA